MSCTGWFKRPWVHIRHKSRDWMTLITIIHCSRENFWPWNWGSTCKSDGSKSKNLKLCHYTSRRRLRAGEVKLLLFLDIGTRWGWVVSVTPRPRFSPGERTPGTHCTGDWVGPRAGLDTESRGKILSPLSRIEPRSIGRPVRSQTLYWLSYPAQCNKSTYGFRYETC
jgi:hypothetical protein